MLKLLEIETTSSIVLFLEGELNWENAEEFSERVYSAAENRNRQIILDMQNVHFIDSSGIGTLVSLKRDFNKKSLPLKVRHVNPMLKLTMTNFLNIEQ